MPVFEYVCTDCGKAFEELLPSGRRGQAVACPDCGSMKTEKQFSVFSAQQADPKGRSLPSGGCGRCGDPNGPCSAN